MLHCFLRFEIYETGHWCLCDSCRVNSFGRRNDQLNESPKVRIEQYKNVANYELTSICHIIVSPILAQSLTYPEFISFWGIADEKDGCLYTCNVSYYLHHIIYFYFSKIPHFISFIPTTMCWYPLHELLVGLRVVWMRDAGVTRSTLLYHA